MSQSAFRPVKQLPLQNSEFHKNPRNTVKIQNSAFSLVVKPAAALRDNASTSNNEITQLSKSLSKVSIADET